MKRLILSLLIVLPLVADGPGERIFLEASAAKLWQNAIGVLGTRNTFLLLYDTPSSEGEVVRETYETIDTNVCPVSAFGYHDDALTKAYLQYPVIAKNNSFVEIVYNVNRGCTGWLKIEDGMGLLLFSDSTAFFGMDAIYLAAVGAKDYVALAYYDKPNGKLIKHKTIMPFSPPTLEERFNPREFKLLRPDTLKTIGIMGYGWGPMGLGIVIKRAGDWMLVGNYDYSTEQIKPVGWIRMRDEEGKLLVWFVVVDRC